MAAKRIVVSYSEIDTFRQCPLKWMVGYKERWQRPDGGGSAASAKGTEFHAVLEAHYGAIREAQQKLGTDEKPVLPTRAQWILMLAGARKAAEKVVAQCEYDDLMRWMYDGYVESYHETDRYWWVASTEGKKLVVLPNPSGGPSRFVLKTKIDLIIRDMSLPGNPLFIVDHKSGKDLPSGRELDLDDQFGLYQVCLVIEGISVVGTIYNAMRTQRNQGDFADYTGKSLPQSLTDRHKRIKMSRKGSELKAIATDAYNATDLAYSTTMAKKMFSSPDPRQCGWKCDFTDAHIAARKLGLPLPVLLSKTGFVQNFERH